MANKKLIISFLFLIFITLSTFCENMIVFRDDAVLLSTEQQDKLKVTMEPILEYGNVAFITNPAESPYEGEASALAKKTYSDLFGKESGTLLLIDMYNRRIEIWSNGLLYKYVNSTRANIIATNTYKYATDGDYYTCATKIFEQILMVAQGGKVNTPLRYVSNLLIAFGLVVMILYLVVFIQRYKNLQLKVTNVGSAEKGKIQASPISVTNIKLLYRHKTKHVESSSSGGGGYSGGGGGGGGGGGHSF